MPELTVGQVVRKPAGYPFDGVVVAAFDTLAGRRRLVVDNGFGMLHIFSGSQLAACDDPAVAESVAANVSLAVSRSA